MKYTKLGKTDLNISRICMGCMGLGNAKTGQHSWTVDEETSRGIIKRALELGINFYDTAPVYIYEIRALLEGLCVPGSSTHWGHSTL